MSLRASRAALWLAVAAALLPACSAPAPPAPAVCREITARDFEVERIIDGDTFVVQYDGEATSVRLFGIDAPELRTPDGPAAREALAAMVSGRVVRLEFPGPRKRDSFGRLLARVYVGQTDVCAELLRQGHAQEYSGRSRTRR